MRRAVHSATALTFGLALSGMVFAQGSPQPPTPNPQTPQTEQPQRQGGNQQLLAMDGKTVTAIGCLMREQEVAGQTPNPAERAGAAPDYILTNVQVRSAEPGAAGATDTPDADAGVSAPSDMKVKLSSVDNDQMRAHLNQQVEITGRFSIDEESAEAAQRPATTPSTAERVRDAAIGDMTELPELTVTNVRPTGKPCTPQQ